MPDTPAVVSPFLSSLFRFEPLLCLLLFFDCPFCCSCTSSAGGPGVVVFCGRLSSRASPCLSSTVALLWTSVGCDCWIVDSCIVPSYSFCSRDFISLSTSASLHGVFSFSVRSPSSLVPSSSESMSMFLLTDSSRCESSSDTWLSFLYSSESRLSEPLSPCSSFLCCSRVFLFSVTTVALATSATSATRTVVGSVVIISIADDTSSPLCSPACIASDTSLDSFCNNSNPTGPVSSFTVSPRSSSSSSSPSSS